MKGIWLKSFDFNFSCMIMQRLYLMIMGTRKLIWSGKSTSISWVECMIQKSHDDYQISAPALQRKLDFFPHMTPKE